MNPENRKYVVIFIFSLVAFIFTLRFFYVQVINESYKLDAQNNVLKHIVDYPSRGLIYDRNGVLLVYNEAAYDLKVVPKQVKNIDTLAFCGLLSIDKKTFIRKMEKASSYSSRKATLFIKDISSKEYASIEEMLFKYPGFFVDTRTLRVYPEKTAAHFLGYIGEVDKSVIERNPYYKSGDNIGKSGIEKEYEEDLRGRRGERIVKVDVFNREVGSYENGAYDTLAISGIDITTTLSAGLQAYGELLMQNKKGGIIAIEPKTGEILAMITSPTYDPNLFVGRVKSDNFRMLSNNDSLVPLFNRATQAEQPPGSIFKIVQALVGQQMGVLSPNTFFYCDGIIGDHVPIGNYNLEDAIKMSSNVYFYKAYKKMLSKGSSGNIFTEARLGLEEWRQLVRSFGLGNPLESDIYNKGGAVPSVELYDKIYGKNRWAFSTIYSNSIGQGEILMTPLQMANLAAIVANNGYYYTPHIVKDIGGHGKREIYLQKKETKINPKYFPIVKEAMRGVVEDPGGTAFRARTKDITICGKTGTVENPHGEDHSVFIAFAPLEDPKIAIAVYIENAGFGGTWAAPIASLMIEKHLKDTISDPYKLNRILEADLINFKE